MGVVGHNHMSGLITAVPRVSRKLKPCGRPEPGRKTTLLLWPEGGRAAPPEAPVP